MLAALCSSHWGRGRRGLHNHLGLAGWQVTAQFEAEVVTLELEFLDVALAKQGEKV